MTDLRTFLLLASIRATLVELGHGDGADSPCARDARESLARALRHWEIPDDCLHGIALGPRQTAPSDEPVAADRSAGLQLFEAWLRSWRAQKGLGHPTAHFARRCWEAKDADERAAWVAAANGQPA